MKNFVKMTKLTAKSGGIKGRAVYISDHDKQEHLIHASDPIDWEPYRAFERKNQKSHALNNEGRELIIALPNIWDKMPNTNLIQKTKDLAEFIIEKDTDYQFAIHYNKDKTNLHMHLIFSERSMTGDIEYYKKDVYLQTNGKVARKKADRAKDGSGYDLPPIHKKGDVKNSGFTAKDTRYKTKDWLSETKEKISGYLQEQDVDIEHPKAFELHQYHEGKGSESKAIKQKNECIKKANKYLTFLEKNKATKEQLFSIKNNVIRSIANGNIVDLKNKLDYLLNQHVSRKNKAPESAVSHENTRSGHIPPNKNDDGFIPFRKEEIDIYNLYRNKRFFISQYENIRDILNSKYSDNDRLKHEIKHNGTRYKQYQKLQSSFFGKIRARKYYNNHKTEIDYYKNILKKDSKTNRERLEKDISDLKEKLNEIAGEINLIDNLVNKTRSECPHVLRIDEKDVLAGRSIKTIEKALKTKNRAADEIESEMAPEKRPSLQESIADAKRSADAYNQDRASRKPRSRGYDLER